MGAARHRPSPTARAAPPARVVRAAGVALTVPAALVLVLAVLLAPPAGAATGGGRDRSVVEAVEPPSDALEVVVVGGDDRLVATVAPGHELEIPGYDGERWVRIDADGVVHENVASLAHVVNASRDGLVPDDVELPTGGDARWEERGDTGTWTWHDHRIHDMGTLADLGSGLLTTWEVPLVLDGEPVVVTGRLDRLAAPSPLPAVAGALAVGTATWLVVRRRSLVASAAAIGAAGVAVAVAAAGSLAEELSVPGASPTWPTVVAVLIGLDAAGTALVATRLRWRGTGTDATTADLRAGRVLLAAAAAVGVGLVLQAASWTEPSLVTSLPAALDRALLAVAAGLVGGAVTHLVASGLGMGGEATGHPVA